MSDEVVPEGQRSKVVKRLQKENKVLRDKLDEIIRQNEAHTLYMCGLFQRMGITFEWNVAPEAQGAAAISPAPTTSNGSEAAPVAPVVNNKKPEAHVKPLKPEADTKETDTKPPAEAEDPVQRCELNEAKEKIKVLETWLQEQLTCFSDKENKLRVVILEKEREIGFLKSELEDRKAEAEVGKEDYEEKEELKKKLAKETSERVATEAALKKKDAELKKSWEQVKKLISENCSRASTDQQLRGEILNLETELESLHKYSNERNRELEQWRFKAVSTAASDSIYKTKYDLQKGRLDEYMAAMTKEHDKWTAEKQDYEKRLEEMTSSCNKLREKLDKAHDYMESERVRAEESTAKVLELEDQLELLNEKIAEESADRDREKKEYEEQIAVLNEKLNLLEDSAHSDANAKVEKLKLRELASAARVKELEEIQLEILNEKLKECCSMTIRKYELEEQVHLLTQQLEEETRARELEKQKLEKEIERLKAKADSCARAMQQELWEAEYARCLEELMASTGKLYKQLDDQQASMESERVHAEQATRRIKELEDEIESLCGKLDGESSARTRDQMVWETEKEDYDRRLEEMMRKEETLSELLSHGSNSNNMVADAVTSTEDDEDLFLENVERRSNSEGNWQQRSEYRPQETVLPFSSFEFFDYDERWRGPFGVRQMQEWYRKGYFPGDLEIRIDGTKLFVYTVAQLIARNGRECPFVFLK